MGDQDRHANVVDVGGEGQDSGKQSRRSSRSGDKSGWDLERRDQRMRAGGGRDSGLKAVGLRFREKVEEREREEGVQKIGGRKQN
ncbi:hypothetical protein QQ045_019952 [Rhodiola kirilowii]